MSYKITNKCIGCDRCESLCPTNAIRIEGENRWIDSKLCNNCVGYYGAPQCAAACPTSGGCVPRFATLIDAKDKTDYWDSWFKTYDLLLAKMKSSQRTGYWERWFNTYSDKLSVLLHS